MDTDQSFLERRPVAEAVHTLPPPAIRTADDLELLLWLSRRRALLRRAAHGNPGPHLADDVALADRAVAGLVDVMRRNPH